LVKKMMGIYVILALFSASCFFLWQFYGFKGGSLRSFPMQFYQHVVGSVDGRPCPAYPVCSAYARQALQQHGLWLGGWLMLDRIIHEADDLQLGPWIKFEGEVRLYDPLHRNDFWLSKDR